MTNYEKIKEAYLVSIKKPAESLDDLNIEQNIIEEAKKEMECFSRFIEELFLKRFQEIRFLIDNEKEAEKFDEIIKENVKSIVETSFKDISNFSTKNFHFW